MIAAFVDESGTHEGAPVVVVAVYAAPTAPVDCWALFRSEWTARVLRGDKSAVVHMKEVIGKLGRDPNWDDRLTSAVEILTKHTKVRIACAIDVAAHRSFMQEWRRRMPAGHPPETAYSLGVTVCLTEVAKATVEAGFDDWITYIFEQGHKNFGQVRVILDALIAQPVVRKEVRLWSYAPERKQDRLELQAADFFAYWLREYVEMVDYRKGSTASLLPVTQGLGPHQYVYWDAKRFSAYLDTQEQAELELRREWWRTKTKRDREKRNKG